VSPDDVKIASVSGNGSGSVLASFLRRAFDFGRLSRLRKLTSCDGNRWIEFKYRSHDGDQGESIRVAIDGRSHVVGAEHWRIKSTPGCCEFANVDALQRSLRFVHTIESVRESIVTPDGEVVALSLEFSHGTPFLLARM
jgi:hypothetical protein